MTSPSIQASLVEDKKAQEDGQEATSTSTSMSSSSSSSSSSCWSWWCDHIACLFRSSSSIHPHPSSSSFSSSSSSNNDESTDADASSSPSPTHPHPRLFALLNTYDRLSHLPLFHALFLMYDRLSFLSDVGTDVLVIITYSQENYSSYAILAILFVSLPYLVMIVALYFPYMRYIYMHTNSTLSSASITGYRAAYIVASPIVVGLDVYYHLRYLISEPEERTPFSTTLCYYDHLRTFTKTCIESFLMTVLQIYVTIETSSQGTLSDSAYIVMLLTLSSSLWSVIQVILSVISDAGARGLTLLQYIHQLCTCGVTSAPYILDIRHNETDQVCYSRMKLDYRQCAQIGTAFAVNTSVKSLDISYNDIGDVGTNSILQGLLDNSHLQELTLTGCHLHSGSVPLIARLLQQHRTLTSLNLSENDCSALGHSGMLGAALRINTTLTTLVLDRNSFACAGVDALTHALPWNCTLRVLSLNGCQLNNTHMSALCQSLQRNRGVMELSLRENPSIDGKGFASLGELLAVNMYLSIVKINPMINAPQHRPKKMLRAVMLS